MNIPLNIDWQQILLHLFNFSILVGGLYLLLFKPVKNFMDKRTKHYQDMGSAAVEREKATAEMEAAMQQRQAVLDAEPEPWTDMIALSTRSDSWFAAVMWRCSMGMGRGDLGQGGGL